MIMRNLVLITLCSLQSPPDCRNMFCADSKALLRISSAPELTSRNFHLAGSVKIHSKWLPICLEPPLDSAGDFSACRFVRRLQLHAKERASAMLQPVP